MWVLTLNYAIRDTPPVCLPCGPGTSSNQVPPPQITLGETGNLFPRGALPTIHWPNLQGNAATCWAAWERLPPSQQWLCKADSLAWPNFSGWMWAGWQKRVLSHMCLPAASMERKSSIQAAPPSRKLLPHSEL